MNKLQKKQQRKLQIINQIIEKKPKITAFELGTKAYKTLKGSYGITLNPFPKRSIPHSQFKLGYDTLRKAAKEKLKPKMEEAA